MGVKRVGGLELEERPAYHAWHWRVSGWLFYGLMAVMALTVLGAFGGGPLSRARAGEPGDALWVEYDRVVRFGAAVRVIVHARAAADGVVHITIGDGLVDAYQVERIVPTPAAASDVGSGVEYRFDAPAGAAADVVFDLLPLTRWGVRGRIASSDAAVDLRQFVLP